MFALILLGLQAPTGNIASWKTVTLIDGGEMRYRAPIISDADYPQAAKAIGAQGAATIQVTLTSTGQITDCAVVASSGYAELDRQSCAVYRARAQFEVFGRTTPVKIALRIVWVLL